MSHDNHLLQLESVDISKEDTPIVNAVSMHVDEGEAVGLIGRNGVGKTTTFEGIMGYSNVTSGSIRFRTTELTDVPSNERAELGLGYQPEGRGLFTGMTVDENLRMPIWVGNSKGRTLDEEQIVSDIYDIFPNLKNLETQEVETLSGGQSRMVAIGRALAVQPDLLLLDEPLEGLAPTIVEDMKEIVKEINEQGIAVLLAEANLAHATELIDRAYIIERGEIYDSGPADKLIQKKDIQNLLQG